jgi:DNA-binding NtrC family response regulator
MLGRVHRVLIVHRDTDLQEVLMTALEGDGIDAVPVRTVTEAAQASSVANFDLTILGWREAMHRSVSIANDDGVSEVARPKPLLVLCSDAEEPREQEASASCEFIREPFTVDGFLEQVRRLIA